MACSFGACICTVERDDYCGPTCRFGISDENEACKCGHAECSVTEGRG
jgi:hypothetical protein